MRTIIAISILFLASRCDSPTTKTHSDKFYYLFYKGDGRIDTVKYDKSYSQSATQFRRLAEDRFIYYGTQHLIQFYADDVNVPIDGGELFYTLDNFGIVYSRAINWPNYSRLHSTNDSIAQLISVAINNIALNPNLHCYNCRHLDKGIPAETPLSPQIKE